jgi:hypothetical protein
VCPESWDWDRLLSPDCTWYSSCAWSCASHVSVLAGVSLTLSECGMAGTVLHGALLEQQKTPGSLCLPIKQRSLDT